MVILGIETSCDETAVSVIRAEGDLKSLSFEVLGSAVNSQIDIHKEYGGVVPNLAKREHIKNLPIVLKEALERAFGFQLSASRKKELKTKSYEPEARSLINLIAVTVGPGLEPALWAGINFAEELSKKWNVPLIGANHMLGHVVSVLFSKSYKLKAISFPAIALLVSGGHTELILLKNWENIEKIGETQDDAVGEAFDKVARMLGLPYPGGPEISRLATQARESGIMNHELRLPRPMVHSKDFNFSFSGLKTAVLYYLRDNKEANKAVVAREFEDAVIETLVSKTKSAIEKYSPKTLIIGGGVIANKALRENFLKLKENYKDLEILIPDKSLTTDNATMIAAAGYMEYLKSGQRPDLRAQGNLAI